MLNHSRRPSGKDWLFAAALGLAIGTIVLGIGGRLAMRGIALVQGRAPGFTIGGTTTVVFLGAVCGVIGSLILAGTRALIPGNRIIRGMLFWLILVLITLRGLSPLDVPKLAFFLPLILGYGTVLTLAWCRFRPAHTEVLVQ
jgi:hypothetical protein